jgi:DNA-directed RNA polymerase alpha subunit
MIQGSVRHMSVQYWREQREAMEKIAEGIVDKTDTPKKYTGADSWDHMVLQEYGKLYDKAYHTDVPQKEEGVPHGWSWFPNKKLKYTEEQEDLQENLDAQRDTIINLIGKRIKETGGTYDEHKFPEILYPSYLDADEAKMIHQYPRLIEAMKEDGRRDKGGILWHFANSLHIHKDNPEKQQKLYNILTHDMDHKSFWGWRGLVDPDDYEDFPVKVAAYWREQREAMEKMAAGWVPSQSWIAKLSPEERVEHEWLMARRAERAGSYAARKEKEAADYKARIAERTANGTLGQRKNQGKPFTEKSHIDDTDINTQQVKHLTKSNITHVHQLTAMTHSEAKNIPGITDHGYKSIHKELERNGLSFKEDTDPVYAQRLLAERAQRNKTEAAEEAARWAARLGAFHATPEEVARNAPKRAETAEQSRMNPSPEKIKPVVSTPPKAAYGTFGEKKQSNQLNEQNHIMSMDIDPIHKRRLMGANITHVHHLTGMTPSEIKKVPSMSTMGVTSIHKELERNGLSFKKESNLQYEIMEKLAEAFEHDPQWQALNREHESQLQQLEHASNQLDPELRQKSSRALEHGLLGGALVGGLGGSVGLGALTHVGNKGMGPIGRGIATIGSSLGGAFIGSMTGGLLGGMASLPVSAHYDRKQGKGIMAEVKRLRGNEFDTSQALSAYEIEHDK